MDSAVWGEQCPAATTCALGSLILDADGSVMKHGGTADVDVKVYKGPESPASGEDFELVGELNLGSIPMAPNAEHRIEDQALEGMVDRIGEHLDAGRCLVKLVQEQTRMPV